MARDIPEGWGYASEFDTREPGDMKGPSGLYQKVLRACESGEVRAYKDGKRWIINRSDVADLKATLVAARASVTSTVSARKPALSDADRLCESIDGVCEEVGEGMREIAHKLEEAVQLFAQIRNQMLRAISDASEQKDAPKPDMGSH